MDETVFEVTEKRCPKCGGEMVFEVETYLLLGGATGRTPQGYNCMEDDCGKKFHTNEVP